MPLVPTAAPQAGLKCASCGTGEDVWFVTSDSQPGKVGPAVTPLTVRIPTRESQLWLESKNWIKSTLLSQPTAGCCSFLL